MPWPHNGPIGRPLIMGTTAMVASAHPQATMAGLQILRAGGNAVDAAVAISAALDVCEPFMSGLGGGGAMLVRPPGEPPQALHYGGRFPAAACRASPTPGDIDKGPRAFAVPGAPAGWHAALDRFGSKPVTEVLAPAIALAETGVPLTRVGHAFFKGGIGRMGDAARAVFAPGGTAPPIGELVRQPNLAATYRTLAREGLAGFYQGDLARATVAAVEAAGGWLAADDMHPAQAEWAEPSRTRYRGLHLFSTGWPFTSYEALLALNLLEALDRRHGGVASGTPDAWHRRIEAAKVAMTDRVALGGESVALAPGLLSARYADLRADVVALDAVVTASGDRWNARPEAGVLPAGDPGSVLRECTTHFNVIDGDGMAVSVTQTLGSAFGSGFLVAETGVLLNNLMFFFDLDAASPMSIQLGAMRSGPLSPIMAFDANDLRLMIGTPGAFGIPQTTMQMVSNVLDGGMNVQAAIEAPRFRLSGGRKIAVEKRAGPEVMSALKALGHDIQELSAWSPLVGGGQGILIDPDNHVRSGGADPRRDGYALGY
ncbi:MAG: gamma-glutamyltransferase family protein [Pseudomonadota bacterium]